MLHKGLAWYPLLGAAVILATATGSRAQKHSPPFVPAPSPSGSYHPGQTTPGGFQYNYNPSASQYYASPPSSTAAPTTPSTPANPSATSNPPLDSRYPWNSYQHYYSYPPYTQSYPPSAFLPWYGAYPESGNGGIHRDYTPPSEVQTTPAQPWATTPWEIKPVGPKPVEASAHVTVKVPAIARLWFEGQLMKSTGPVRAFKTPLLTPGFRYSYEIRARWEENRREHVETKQVKVSPGASVEVNFSAQ